MDLERLTITSRPFKTLSFFVLAIALNLERTCSSVLKKGYQLKTAMLLVVATWLLLMFTDGLNEKVPSCFKLIRTYVFCRNKNSLSYINATY